MKESFFLLFIIIPTLLFSQEKSFEGQVVDVNDEPLSFVNILLYEPDVQDAFYGTTTDDLGYFILQDITSKMYTLEFSMIGFTTVIRTIDFSKEISLGKIVLTENLETLSETVITVKKPTIKKEAGKLVFNVENTSLSSGNTFDLLSKTPGVLVIGDNVSIKNSATIIYLNGKRVYLSASEVSSLLRSMDASNVKSIEVITNPSSKYDAEAGAVLNIVTSKSISVGYKGSVYGTYEQGVFPKYNFGTSHFYKNNKVNLYASYNYIPRKEYKQDDNDIIFFTPNGDVKSIWDTDFNKTSKSYGHQGNIIADFDLKNNQSLSLSVNANIKPNRVFDNNVSGEIFNAQHELDSIFKTHSDLQNDTYNVSVNAEHKIEIGTKGTQLSTNVNFIKYSNEQDQKVCTNYYHSSGEFIRNNSFNTYAIQDSKIFTGQLDFTIPMFKGEFEIGSKYSYINTNSGLDFFNLENETLILNPLLSDSFKYKESIYAGYFNFAKKWEDWSLNVGLRTEITSITGNSQDLGVVNSQEYTEPFPTASLLYNLNENNSIEFSYARRLSRPRYQSLNPFKYFINENNFNGGNPNLVPAIDNKYRVSYSYKNSWIFEAYYIDRKNTLSILTFQDNENSTLRNVDVNLIGDINYSVDILYNSSFNSWWYFWGYASGYYVENEFFALESEQEKYSNDTFGMYLQFYNGITLSKENNLTSDITFLYVSNSIVGSYEYSNQLNVSFSIKKTFWDKRASLSAGVNDIFDTFNVSVASKYYNQDNSYFAHSESRLFKFNFKYNFGNARLRDNNRSAVSNESERLD